MRSRSFHNKLSMEIDPIESDRFRTALNPVIGNAYFQPLVFGERDRRRLIILAACDIDLAPREVFGLQFDRFLFA
jgi:hypothetical protein